MNNQKYEGWTNYETWSVKLLIDNDQGSQEYWHDVAVKYCEDGNREDNFYSLSKQLKAEHEDNNPLSYKCDIYSQLLQGAMSEVNWYEVAENIIGKLEETKVQVAV